MILIQIPKQSPKSMGARTGGRAGMMSASAILTPLPSRSVGKVYEVFLNGPPPSMCTSYMDPPQV